MKNADKAIELSPRNDNFYILRATARIVMHDFENAIADCTKAIELNASNAYAYALKADCQLLKGKPQEARIELEKALAIPTKLAAIQSAVSSINAIYKLAAGETQAAKECAQSALSTFKCTSAYYALGLVLLKESQCEAAIAEFSKAIQRDSYCAEAYWYRHEAYIAAGKVDLAQKDRESAERLFAFPYPMFEFAKES